LLSPLPGIYSATGDQRAYYENLLRRVESLPGVRRASLSSFTLYWNKAVPDPVRSLDGGREARAQIIRATDGYFATVGLRLTAGEDFGRHHAEPEAIVSESLARTFGAAVGTSIAVGEAGASRRYRIVGIAPTVRISMADVRDAEPLVVYLNYWQDPRGQRWPTVIIEGQPDVKAFEATVQSLGREYVSTYRTLDAARDEAIVEDRLMAWLAGIFGFLALVLAAVGMFAVLSCYVARRTGEIGLRMALGATAAQIRAVVLAQIAPVALGGSACGLLLAAIAGRALSSTVFGVAPADPLVLGAAVASMAATVLLAAWIPARRAAAIQPLEALRRE
jgi:predicted lysophospholipase L1 biosynthesis ABC-type transport system permease subunit